VILLILIGLIAGVATAVSPCVLPVLPVLLAGGASGRKPLRIVVGLVLSFSAFTLFATWVLDKLGLPDDLLRNLAIAFLFVMAVVLLVPQAGLLVERGLAFFSRLRPANAGGGLWLGVSLGLVFVPCAGPFLGALSAAAAHESFGFRTIVATLAYAIGAGIPMLAIAYGGRGLSGRIRQHASSVRLASGAVIAVVAFALVFHVDDHLTNVRWPWTSYVQDHIEASSSSEKQLARLRGEKPAPKPVATATKGLPDYGAAPGLTAGGAWINSKPLTLAQLRGKVVLVDFWTYSCINCIRALPYVRGWADKYKDHGLVVIGVHAPEFAFEKDPANVAKAVKDLGVDYPVALDNDYAIWKGFHNQYWPAHYFIDTQGQIRHHHFGEGSYRESEDVIRQLLTEAGQKNLPGGYVSDDHRGVEAAASNDPTRSPETYVGYARAMNFVGGRVARDESHDYRAPGTLAANQWSLDGRWTVHGENAQLDQAGGSIVYRFRGRDLHLVLGPASDGKPIRYRVTIDGKPPGADHGMDTDADGNGTITGQRLYQLVRQANGSGERVFEITFLDPGVQAYAFTFG
jgi:cytochrome c biogenesis protein CcdA/thiol-disulfide isomerase/thioredoxin